MKTIDAKGKTCPIPLIMTKKAMAELSENETLEIILDNEISKNNVVHFLREHHMNIKEEQSGDMFRVVVNKTGEIPEDDQCRGIL
jgi:TusA-related sulfurtransferase